MRMVEPFGDAKNGSEAGCEALVGIIERAVSRMITGRFCFAIVVTHDGGNETAVAAIESSDVAIEGQIFAMFVMAFVADCVTNVVKQRGRFEKDARFGRKMMNRLQLIEELQAEFANVFGVAAIAVEAAREDASSAEQFARMSVVAMRFLAGEYFTGDFAKQAFAEPDARNGEGVEIQVAAECEKDETGDSHDVGAVAAHAVDFHARFDIAAQQIGKT